MVKIEWFDLKSDAVKEYLETTINYIKKQYESFKGSLTDEIKNEVFCDIAGNFSEMKVEKFLKYTRCELLKNKFFSEYISNENKLYHQDDEIIKQIFEYKYVYGKNLRHKLLISLKVDCCPYCNRQYITSWKNSDGKDKTTADLDHYYHKDVFPLFAFSLFNFVPSCQICNSRMKHDKFEDCLYPYEESFGENAYFTVSIVNNCGQKSDEYYKKLLYAFQGREDCDFSIIIDNVAIDSKLRQRIENSKKLFKLEEVYQTHREYVRELLIKQRIYDEGAYLNMLRAQFSKLNFTEAELEVFLYGFHWDDEDHHTRPLSKLTYDLIKRNTGF